MITALVIIGVAWFAVYRLNHWPIPADVEVGTEGGTITVRLKEDDRGPYARDKEWLFGDTRWFFGLRVALAARKLRFRWALTH